jgi:hypothetical protein
MLAVVAAAVADVVAAEELVALLAVELVAFGGLVVSVAVVREVYGQLEELLQAHVPYFHHV